MNRKPFNNKPNYDPGRMRAVIDFWDTLVEPTPSGGTTIGEFFVYRMKAVELQIRDGDQFAAAAGLSVLEEGRYFVIRNTREFIPRKVNVIYYGGSAYVIHAIIPQGSPVKYYKILAQRRHVK